MDKNELSDTLYLITFKCNNCGNIITALRESDHKCTYCGYADLSKPTQDEMCRVVNDYCKKIIK